MRKASKKIFRVVPDYSAYQVSKIMDINQFSIVQFIKQDKIPGYYLPDSGYWVQRKFVRNWLIERFIKIQQIRSFRKGNNNEK